MLKLRFVLIGRNLIIDFVTGMDSDEVDLIGFQLQWGSDDVQSLCKRVLAVDGNEVANCFFP